MSRAILCVLLGIVALAQREDRYTDKYDRINQEVILKNDRLFNSYALCLLRADNRRCTPDGRFLKSLLAAAITNDCAKCNTRQKSNAHMVIKFMINKKPDIWKALEAKYDPTGEFLKKHPELSNNIYNITITVIHA